MELVARQRHQTVVLESDTGRLWSLVDRARIQQVLTNFIGNACKYGPAKSRITVKCAGTGAEIRVSVSDEGEGIPTDEQRRIFDAFTV
jgi:signal transduction histidine kinase